MKPANKIKRLVQAASFKASPQADTALWAEVLKKHGGREASNHTPRRRALGKLRTRLRTGRGNAAILLAAGMAIGVAIGSTLLRPQTDRASQATSPSGARTPDDLQPDIFSMRRMAAAQDVRGLAAILSDGHFESRLLAANFLARMAPLPALETVSMSAGGELRADRRDGNLRLYSTGHSDWLELADSLITAHIGNAQQRTTLIRLTLAKGDDGLQQTRNQANPDRLRRQRADLEKQLAAMNGIPGDVKQLRSQIEVCSHILDLIDGAVYVSPAGGGLRVQDRVSGRETHLLPSADGVQAEWHGVTVDANCVTLQDGLAPVRTSGPIAPPDDWRSRFNQAYSLADGEILRWVRPPFVPERQYHVQEMHENSRAGPGAREQFMVLLFRWDGALRQTGAGVHERLLEHILKDLGSEHGLRKYETSGPKELLQLRLNGDWIVRTGTSVEERFGALESILEREMERRIRFVRRSVEREVIVVRGRYERRPLEGHDATEPIYLFAEDVLDQSRLGGPRVQAGVAGLLDRVGERFNRPIILETQGLDQVSVAYQPCLSFLIPIAPVSESERTHPLPMRDDRNLDPVLANLTRQTSLEFCRETRPFDTWLVSEVDGPNDTDADRPAPPQK